LRDTDPSALAAAAAAVDARMGSFAGRTGALADRWGSVAATVTPFSPVVDGEILTEDPWAALAAGAAANVRLLAGHTRDEWRLFLVNHGFAGLHLAAAHAAGGGRAHLYELAYRAPASDGILGACHALDVPLVFGTLRAAPDVFGDSPPQEAAEVSSRMRAAWRSMATDGDPGLLPFDEDQRLTGVFDVAPTLQAQQYPEERSRALWSEHRFSALDLPG
jgi:para-nitrobenzyl esterase